MTKDFEYKDDSNGPPLLAMGRPARADNKPFWFIFNPHYHLPPTRLFDTKEQAEAVAGRMAEQYGQEFFVCQAVTRFTRSIKTNKKALK